MGGRIGGDDDDIMSDINITPFVDIMLVVLIIFMVTTSMVDPEAIKVNLPDAASGEATESISLGVTLQTDGTMLLDGLPTSTEGLAAGIKSAKAQSDDVIVLIAADEMVAHGRVVWVMDFVRSNGVGKFAINIDKAGAIPPDPAEAGKGASPEAVPTDTIEP